MSFYFNPQQALEGALTPASQGPDTGFIESTLLAFESAKLTDLTVSEAENFSNAYDPVIERLNENQPFENLLSNPYAGASLPANIDTRGVALPNDPRIQSNLRQAQMSRSERVDLVWAEIQRRRAVDPQAFSDLPANRASFEKQVREDVAARVKELDAQLDRSSALGQFVGTAGALLTQEPLTVLTLPFGAPARAGVLRTALLEAGIAGGVETIIQPAVQAYREELGLEAGAKVGFENVLMAMGGAGILGAGFKGIAKALGAAGAHFERVAQMNERQVINAFDELVPSPTAEQRAARDQLELDLDFIDQNPGTSTAAHRFAAAAAQARVENGSRFTVDAAAQPDLFPDHLNDLSARLDGIEADVFGAGADPRIFNNDIAFASVDDTGAPIVQTRKVSDIKADLDADRALLAEVEACA